MNKWLSVSKGIRFRTSRSDVLGAITYLLVAVCLSLAVFRPAFAEIDEIKNYSRNYVSVVPVAIAAGASAGTSKWRVNPKSKILGVVPDSDNATNAQVQKAVLDNFGYITITLSGATTNGVLYNVSTVR